MQIGNSPQQETILRLQARKSFALGLWIQDSNGNPLDITDTTTTIVVRKRVNADVVNDSGNLISNSTAEIVAPTLGYLRFNLQASDLNHAAGTYRYTISMESRGYSTVIVNGDLELEQNMEFSSINKAYNVEEAVSTALQVMLDGAQVVVRTGPTLSPGEATFTKMMEQRLLEVFAGQAAVGRLFTADDLADGTNRVVMTKSERYLLANMTLSWDRISAKPVFGDIVSRNAADFIQKQGVRALDITSGVIDKARVPRLIEQRGVTWGPNLPSGGVPGDIHFRVKS